MGQDASSGAEFKLHVKKGNIILISMVPDDFDPLVAGELKQLGLKATCMIPKTKTPMPAGLETKTVNGHAGIIPLPCKPWRH